MGNINIVEVQNPPPPSDIELDILTWGWVQNPPPHLM